jgi:hypothetical protein
MTGLTEARGEANRVLIPVPWKQADALQSRLAAHGVTATACFETRERSAAIEVPADADLTTVRALLGLPR